MDGKNVSFEFMSAEWTTDLKMGQVCNVHPYSESGSNVWSYYEVKESSIRLCSSKRLTPQKSFFNYQ